MTKERPQRSRSLVGWLRRRALPMSAKLCSLVGLMILGLWIAGRVLTDQYQWSQYLWWVPPIWMIGLAWMCLGMSAFLAIFSRRLGGLLLRPVLLLACVGCTGYLMIGVWHIHRAVLPSERTDDAIRIAHWNHAGQPVLQTGWEQALLDQGVDIVLITNAQWGTPRQDILNNFASYAPEEKERWINYSYKIHGDPSHFWVQDNALIASRYPMIRTGIIHFGSAKRQKLFNHSSSNLGWILFIELNIAPKSNANENSTTPTPIPFVVWLVDLPSDPYNARQLSMQRTRDAIDSWTGTSWNMGRHVWEQRTTPADLFPAPDLIIGDFNTIRGSDSLTKLAPGMTEAFSAVGYGRARSWTPTDNHRIRRQLFKVADWHIDLSLVGNNWKPARYRLEDGSRWGSTEHRMQIVDISPVLPKTQD